KARVLSVPAARHAGRGNNSITNFESRNVLTRSLHLPGQLGPEDACFPRLSNTEHQFAMGRIDLVTNVKLRTLQSPVDTVVACMAISTSLSLGAGLSTSLNCRTVGGPYCVCAIAFIGLSFWGCVHTPCLHGFRVSA